MPWPLYHRHRSTLEPPCSAFTAWMDPTLSSFTRPPVAAPQLFTYLRSHTRGGRCVCMRCRDIMLEKYELTTPGYTDSDDENEMRLSKVAASGGDRRVIHRRGLKIARSQRWIVCYFENRAIAPSPFGRPLCCKGRGGWDRKRKQT